MAGDQVDIGPTGVISSLAGYGLADITRTAVPADNEPGFAHDCILRKVNGTNGTCTIYVNVGTSAACNFDTLTSLVTSTISTSLSTETISGTNLTLNSTNEFNLQFGGVSALAVDDAAIVSNTAAAATSGKSIFLGTQAGGTAAASTTGPAGADFTLTVGAGTNGVDDADVNPDGGASGCISLVTVAGAQPGVGGGTAGANGNDGVIRLNAASGSGGVFFKQAAPTAETTTTPTLTAAELLGGLITCTQTTAVTATLDTGTAMDAAIHSQVGANEAFFWTLINIGSALAEVTVTAAAGHTIVGSAVVRVGEAARFETRRTAANTFITYRLAGGGGTLTLGPASNIALDTATGTKIGTATTQKLAFYNSTPIVQASAYTQTYATADKTHANPTATVLTDNSAGTANTTIQALADGATYANDVAAIRNNFADLVASNNALIVDLADAKQLINSLIDDMQALGLVG